MKNKGGFDKMKNSISFVIGKDEIPEWFNEECRKGKARVVYDDDKNIELIKIYSTGASYELTAGDKVILNKHGLVGIKS